MRLGRGGEGQEGIDGRWEGQMEEDGVEEGKERKVCDK